MSETTKKKTEKQEWTQREHAARDGNKEREPQVSVHYAIYSKTKNEEQDRNKRSHKDTKGAPERGPCSQQLKKKDVCETALPL